MPIEDSVGALKQFQDEGKIRYIGLSEVDLTQLKTAQAIADIVSVQNEYNVLEKRYDKLLDYCSEQRIAFIPWFPLGGLSGGAKRVSELLAPIAQKYGALPQQLALSWLLRRSPYVLPIPGTLSVSHLESNLRSSQINLSDEDFAAISALS